MRCIAYNTEAEAVARSEAEAIARGISGGTTNRYFGVFQLSSGSWVCSIGDETVPETVAVKSESDFPQ